MPQSIYDDRDNGITFACDCEIIPLPLDVSIGAGMGKSNSVVSIMDWYIVTSVIRVAQYVYHSARSMRWGLVD